MERTTYGQLDSMAAHLTRMMEEPVEWSRESGVYRITAAGRELFTASTKTEAWWTMRAVMRTLDHLAESKVFIQRYWGQQPKRPACSHAEVR